MVVDRRIVSDTSNDDVTLTLTVCGTKELHQGTIQQSTTINILLFKTPKTDHNEVIKLTSRKNCIILGNFHIRIHLMKYSVSAMTVWKKNHESKFTYLSELTQKGYVDSRVKVNS